MTEVLTPLYDRIVVLRNKEEEETKGGFIIPENGKEKPQRGTVVSIGAGRLDINNNLLPLIVQPGDVILFDKYAGTEVKLNNVEYLIMHEQEVMGVLTTKEIHV